MCRKILMHIAVDKGAKEGQTFVFYLDHLAEKGYITPPMKAWTTQIRANGNQSTHELDAPDAARATNTLTFTAMLLVLVYEMEFKHQRGLGGG